MTEPWTGTHSAEPPSAVPRSEPAAERATADRRVRSSASNHGGDQRRAGPAGGTRAADLDHVFAPPVRDWSNEHAIPDPTLSGPPWEADPETRRQVVDDASSLTKTSGDSSGRARLVKDCSGRVLLFEGSRAGAEPSKGEVLETQARPLRHGLLLAGPWASLAGDHRRLVEFIDDVVQLEATVSGDHDVAGPLGVRSQRHHDAEALGRRLRMDGRQATDLLLVRPTCSRVPISDFAPPANPRRIRRGFTDRVHDLATDPRIPVPDDDGSAHGSLRRAVATAMIETILLITWPPGGIVRAWARTDKCRIDQLPSERSRRSSGRSARRAQVGEHGQHASVDRQGRAAARASGGY